MVAASAPTTMTARTVRKRGTPALGGCAVGGVAGQGRTELIALQGAMQLALRSAGIELENRVYAPHLTLGRVRREPRARERASLAEWMHRWQDVQFGALPIDAISLMRSELSVRPPRYTRLESFPLQ